jgi:hypothetical protein
MEAEILTYFLAAVTIVMIGIWSISHIAEAALHAAARIRDTFRNLFPRK